MTTTANPNRRRRSVPSLPKTVPGSRTEPIPSSTGATLSGGHAHRRHKFNPVRKKELCTRQKKKSRQHLEQNGKLSKDLGRLQRTKWTETTPQDHDVGTTHEEETGNSLSPTNTYSGDERLPCETYSQATQSSLEAYEKLPGIGQSGFGLRLESKPDGRTPASNGLDTPLLRHRALKESEYRERSEAREKYRETRDPSVFDPFMALFIDGPDRPNLGSWKWDKSVERWRKEHEFNGRIVWGPTDDSFI